MKKSLIFAMLLFSLTTAAQDRNYPLPSSGNVTLPLDEYNKLMDLANKPSVKPETAPVPYAIKRADLKLRVGNESVSGTIQCDGEVFAKGATRIPLLSAPAILDANQGGKGLPLEQEGGVQTAILPGPGEFSIMLDAGIPLSIEASRASFNLPVPTAGSARLWLEIPGEHTNVKINSGLITSRSTDNGRTIVEATLVPGQTTSVWWTTREIAAPVVPREIRFLSDIKTLVSVSEADLRLAVLADITVIQGEPAQFEVGIPGGFEITGVSGASLESEEAQTGSLVLKINDTARRSHQFLISMEKPLSAPKADIPFISFKGAQRDTGEILVEGDGTIELSAAEGGTLKRIDLKEVNAYLRSLARHPQHAAFRYHRQPSDPPSLTLSWIRFPDGAVLPAAAERAIITTMVTSEGRSLTEVKLVLKNQAQPFLRVGLPPGASILTADVAGEQVKPVQGSDGSRVPLLRPGFRPSGSYNVSFVMMHAGTPFAKKGDSELSLPKMDIPINLLQWEVFLPELYKVKNFGGDAISMLLLPPGVLPQGTEEQSFLLAESSTVSGIQAATVNVQRDGVTVNDVRSVNKRAQQVTSNEASLNVVNLQRRVAGVLPIRVDVPHAGNSYSFVRPLVLDEETKVSFRYKSK